MKLIFTLIILFPFLIYKNILFAQTDTDSVTQQSNSNAVSISGEVGVYGELYNISNAPNRRPNSTGRIFLRPTLDLFGLFQIPFEFLISSEGTSARQNINQFGISPKWSWGSMHIDNFNEDFSQFTLNGIKIRGGGLNLNPGFVHLSTAVGFTNRSVFGGAQDGAFERFLLAAKLGFGDPEQTYVDVIFLKAKDKISSIDQNVKTITLLEPNGDEAYPIGTLQTIRWTSSKVFGAVKIEISRDGGATYELIQNNQPNLGNYDWIVSAPSTFQALIKISSLEDSTISDQSDFFFSIGTGSDFQFKPEKRSDEIINANAVTPQENLVLALAGKINILENKLSFEFEASGSVYSRDTRASELDLDSISVPKFISNIFTPRIGTNYDFAVNTLINLNLQSFSSRIGYKRIGPGYQSLGLSYMLNDQQEISLLNSIRISKYAFTLGYINQSDNLLNQKLFTTSRNIFTAGLSGSLTDFWNTSIMANILNMTNNSKNDSTKTDFGNFILSTTQSFLISQTSFVRSFMVTYVYQNSDNKSYHLKNNKTFVHTLNAGLNFLLNQNLNASLNGGVVNSKILDIIKITTTNFSVSIQHNGFERKLNTSVSFNSAFRQGNNSYRTGLNIGYSFTSDDTIILALWYSKFNGDGAARSDFNELMTNLSYSHRF